MISGSEQHQKQSSNRLNKSTKKSQQPELSNVNSYRHFLALPHTGHNYIKWAFALRASPSKKITPAGVPPSAFFKATQIQKIRSNLRSLQKELTNQNSQKAKEFIQNKEKQRKWRTIPKIERHEDPILIRSKSLRKSLLSPEDFQTGYDGSHRYPSYTQKIIKTKNSNEYRHMIKGKVSLPSICWQTNLRSY